MNTNNYVYCETCDIWYNKALKERGNRERTETQKSKYPTIPFIIIDCPLCKSKKVLSVSRQMNIDSSHLVNLYRQSK
jgi:Zn finger protein HypA/HybF involved in hydrogenase expression